MSIFNLLKKFKLPGFEDDFIENPTEKAVAETPKIRGRVIYDPKEEALRQFIDEETPLKPNIHGPLGDPDDVIYFPTPPFRD